LIVAPVFVPQIQDKFNGEKLCIVSPDVGGVVRARALAKRLNADLAIIDKRREKAGVSEVMHVIGEVEDKICILVDDIVDSGGTLCNAAVALKEHKAKEVHAYVVHGVLSGGAVARVSASPLEKLVITDTIAATESIRMAHNIEQLTVAPLIGEAIRRTSDERSISALFR
jgi:ribose-phosphate pyrophosphokinase